MPCPLGQGGIWQCSQALPCTVQPSSVKAACAASWQAKGASDAGHLQRRQLSSYHPLGPQARRAGTSVGDLSSTVCVCGDAASSAPAKEHSSNRTASSHPCFAEARPKLPKLARRSGREPRVCNTRKHRALQRSPPAGLEPAIFGLEVRRLVH